MITLQSSKLPANFSNHITHVIPTKASLRIKGSSFWKISRCLAPVLKLIWPFSLNSMKARLGQAVYLPSTFVITGRSNQDFCREKDLLTITADFGVYCIGKLEITTFTV